MSYKIISQSNNKENHSPKITKLVTKEKNLQEKGKSFLEESKRILNEEDDELFNPIDFELQQKKWKRYYQKRANEPAKFTLKIQPC